MDDKFKTRSAIFFLFFSLFMPFITLIYGFDRWNAVSILGGMGIGFALPFLIGVLFLVSVKEFDWFTASMPFLFGGFYTVLPDLPGSIDDTAITATGALITFFLAQRRNRNTPKWILVPLLIAATYTFFGGTLPGPVDEIVVDILALLVASVGVRRAENEKAELSPLEGQNPSSSPSN